MWWIAITFGVALLVVLITWGSLPRLSRLPIQSVWLLFLALAIQITLEYVSLPRDRIDNLGFGLLMASYALLLAFCFVNLRISAVFIITIGIALNTLVIGLNQGMPTKNESVTAASGRTVERPIKRSVKHRPESDNDLLQPLGDFIVLPKPIHEVLSPGDLVIALGIVAVCFAGSRRPKTRRGRDRVRARSPQPVRPRTLAQQRSPLRARVPATSGDRHAAEPERTFSWRAPPDKGEPS